MAGVNKVILVGNLGKDPEVRSLDNGAKVASFSIATTESYTDKNTNQRVDQTEWHNIVVWRGLADVSEKYLKKGSQVYIEGKIKSRSYENKEGETRYITEIVANTMTMLGKKGDENGNDSYQPPSQPSVVNEPKTSETESPNSFEAEADDLPF